MVFSSLSFMFVFLPIVLILYYVSPFKIKNLIILVSGIVFYAWGEPIYICIMLFSTIVDYSAGLLMHKFDEKPKLRLMFLIISVCINLGLLATFKYSSFIIDNVNSLFRTDFVNPELPLPIGISFYTFQSMSYTIDLYMRKIKVQKNIISFTSYVSLFPQIVAGPIVRYSYVANEIDTRIVSVSKISKGVGIFIKGLAKKILLANTIGMVWSTIKVMDYETLPALTAWLGIIAFTFQIYYDFSGYSDMAKGLGKMLGFNFPINFNHPYVSQSISEFWRRWHITLGSWFKSYVYFPLGGNRVKSWKVYRNLFIVWFLTGLWHGASWNFIIWGLYFGFIIMAERLFLAKLLKKLPKFLRVTYAFLLVVFGWVFFEIEAFSDIMAYFSSMFGLNGAGFANGYSVYTLGTNILVYVACIIGSTTLYDKTLVYLKRNTKSLVPTVLPIVQVVTFVVCIAFLVTATYNPFLYFRF